MPELRRRRVFCLVALLAAVTACRSQEPVSSAGAAAVDTSVGTSVDTTAIRSAIDSLAANVMRAHETGDAELFASTWAMDGIMSAPGSAPVRGRDSIVAAFQRRPPLPPGARMSIHPTELQILGPEWAYVFGVDTLTYTPQGATAPVNETSTFLVLLRKTGEGWQTYREVLSANQP